MATYKITLITNILFMLIITLSQCAESPSPPNCVLFNYGDSNSDTGAVSAANGTPLPLPYGLKFRMNETTARYSDGKLYIDFLCESLNITYLSPYLDSFGSFYNGVNFAFSASTAQNEFVHSCYPLSRQVSQFESFQGQTKQLRQQGKAKLLSDDQFKKAVHCVDIGQNDLAYAFMNGTTIVDMMARVIPQIVLMIGMSVKRLYGAGARKFILYNTGPLGCLPIFSLDLYNYSKEVDESGCRVIQNIVAKELNEKLALSCETMKSDLRDATIICADMFSIKYDLIANAHKYGFEKPLEACYIGNTGCTDPSKRVSLDGTHYTDAANYIIASKIFSGGFWWPNMTLQHVCNL